MRRAFLIPALALNVLAIPVFAREAIPRHPGGEIPPVTVHALLVTHASAIFDPAGSIRPGVDRVVSGFRAHGAPVIYLMNDDESRDDLWLASDRSPDLAIFSRSGEHEIEYRAAELTVAGGFLSLCQARSVSAAADSYFGSRRGGEFVVHYPLDATYEERYAFAAEARTPEQRDRIWALEGPVTLEAILAAVGPEAFGRALRNLHIVDEDGYRIRASVNGRVVARWGHGKRRVLLEFRK